MRYSRLCFEPEFKWCNETNLIVYGAVQEIYRSVDSFCPEVERKIEEMQHTSSSLADGSVISFCVAVLLRSVWRGHFAYNAFLLKK